MVKIYKNYSLISVLLSLLLLAFTACSFNQTSTVGTQTPANTPIIFPTSEAMDNSGYPIVDSGYPMSDNISMPVTEESYPGPGIEPASGGPAGPNFAIDRALKPGDTLVTGRAPRNLTIGIVDITFGGGLLGTGQSNENGDFAVSVDPLLKNHRIGLTLIGTGKTMGEIAIEYMAYRGEGFVNVPNIGVYLDSVMVKP